MAKTCTILFLLLFLVRCPVWATTEETVEKPDSSATITTPQQQVDLLPQPLLKEKDTFGPVSNYDPTDIGYSFDQKEKKWLWTIIFWVDPLNGSWIGQEGVPVGPPPYRVFVGGVPEGSCKFNKRWNEPEAVPLNQDKDGKATLDNIQWVLRFHYYGEVGFNLLIVAADGSTAFGNIVTCSPAFSGGQKTKYKFNLHKDGTVTGPPTDD